MDTIRNQQKETVFGLAIIIAFLSKAYQYRLPDPTHPADFEAKLLLEGMSHADPNSTNPDPKVKLAQLYAFLNSEWQSSEPVDIFYHVKIAEEIKKVFMQNLERDVERQISASDTWLRNATPDTDTKKVVTFRFLYDELQKFIDGSKGIIDGTQVLLSYCWKLAVANTEVDFIGILLFRAKLRYVANYFSDEKGEIIRYKSYFC